MTDPNEYPDTTIEQRIVGFICNWSGYSGFEMAGIHGREYPASVKMVRLMCLGRLHLGLILKAFELGTDGVILLGCPSDDCHYGSGMSGAKELVAEAKKMLRLMGIDPKRLTLAEVPLGRDDIFVRRVSAFVKRISAAGSSRRHGAGRATSPVSGRID